VQLPGFQDPARAKALLGTTAQLEFKSVDDESSYYEDLYNKLREKPDTTRKTEKVNKRDQEVLVVRGTQIGLAYEGGSGAGGSKVSVPYLTAKGDSARQVLEELVAANEVKMPAEREMGIECIPYASGMGPRFACESYRTYLLKSKVELTGENVSDARVALDDSPGGGNRPYVSMNFDATGAREFERVTGENIYRRMAIVLDQTVSSAPVIQGRIGGGRAQITLGSYKNFNELAEEASDLANVLNSGALPAPVTIGEERTVGASLGPELIKKGSYAVAIGLLLVLVFMVAYYGRTGIVADVALALNAILILAAMATFNATLTLPGIAGFVLTLGMAVDANVLINERIREELRLGKTARAAVEAGYGRAFWTIFDANVTTLIAGFVLLKFGSGPIRGFAVMLIIGILASMFTAIMVTRTIVDGLMARRGGLKISI